MTSFEDQLRAELTRAAGEHQPDAADWARVQQKLTTRARTDALDSDDDADAADRRTAPAASRWRVPLLAAAAVAAIVIATVAAVSLGRPGNHHAAAPSPTVSAPIPGGGSNASGLVFAHYPGSDAGDSALLEGAVTDSHGCLAVTPDGDGTPVVPVFPVPSSDPAALRIGDEIALAGGFVPADGAHGDDIVIPDECRDAGDAEQSFFIAWTVGPRNTTTYVPPATVSVAPTTDTPPVGSGAIAVPVDTSRAATSRQRLSIRIQPDQSLAVTGADSDATLTTAPTASDGTPLGYLRVSPSRAGGPNTLDSGGSYLYGIVGPAVDRIAITTTPVAQIEANNAAETPFTFASLLWVVADTHGTTPATHDVTHIAWSPIADGWRAFAIQSAAPPPALTVFAWGQDRTLLQVRRFMPDRPAADLPVDSAPDLDVWGG